MSEGRESPQESAASRPAESDVPNHAQSIAQHLSTEWQLDGEDLLLSPEVLIEPEPQPAIPIKPAAPSPQILAPVEPPPAPLELLPDSVASETPAPEPAPSSEPRRAAIPAAAEHPPSLTQLVEAMLFVGGPPLTAKVLSTVVRAPEEQFPEVIETLNRRYLSQRRPYSIQVTNGGYLLSVRPSYRALTAKLTGGPKSTRLSQSALDVLSLVAYRQPISRADVDAMRGNDSGAILRQLVRLGLISSGKADLEAGTTYSTTSRFLELFQLPSLDDLPRLGEASKAFE